MSARPALLFLASLGLIGCAHRSPLATTDGGLDLDRVVLYRSGIGYFERRGEVDGDVLRIKVRKDQVNDLLKSLTVVDQSSGKTLSVSMPLDPQTWANAALGLLQPGEGNLAGLLDALRGTEVVLGLRRKRVRGRIVMVEEIINEAPEPLVGGGPPIDLEESRDYKVTLLRGRDLEVVRLSQVRSVVLRDGDLALQLHRSLDASAGEGMFEQVAIEIRLAGARKHDLMVSYVVAAPIWKPTYRVVLPEGDKGEALLQAWAVVDNTSGEGWQDVNMSLTSGAPIAFRYDLHTPRDIERADLSGAGTRKRAAVAMGESSYDEPAPEPEAAAAPSGGWGGGGGAEGEMAMDEMDFEEERADLRDLKKKEKKADKARRTASAASRPASPKSAPPPRPYEEMPATEEQGPQLDSDSLRRSMQADAKARAVAGLTQFELGDRVTVPEGTSTMVALVNQGVEAEQTYLFRPGGAGVGYEVNPYRVIRFKNSTPFVLEPGPIAIYAAGSFVGEGLSEAVGAGSSATIPFAVEPSIMVSQQREYSGAEMRIVKIVRGVLECENFQRTITTWSVKGRSADRAYQVLIRHPKAGPDYTLEERPPGTEDLDGAYLIPVAIAAGKTEGSVKVVEQTPSHMTLSIWDGRAPELINTLLRVPGLDPAAREKLQPIITIRQTIGKIDTEIEGLKAQQRELDQRANETRQNLEAIKKDPRAGELRDRLSKRLDEFTRDGDKIGRHLVELQSLRLEKKIELEDRLQGLDLRAPAPEKKK
ncbi:MAG: DUF4139 domain-containing protein [Myxococcales bacterium]|nr:DUF4139 domain-containing protein [Myxococcales bacterium]MCB9706625.1 DUF4139 domain-containing protein [Myxococcales bacterium]